MIKKWLHKIMLLLLLLLIGSGLANVTVAWEKQGNDAYSMTDFELFEDANGEYDFAAISSAVFTNQFQHYTKRPISLGISKSVFWLRFPLPPNDNSEGAAKQLLQLNNPSINKIDVFIPVADDSSAKIHYLIKQLGVNRPSANRDIMDNSWLVSIPHQYVQGQYIYLRLESISLLRLPIMVWPDNSFMSAAFAKNLSYGVFYGVLIAMFLYNLFIFFVLRDKTYLFYVLYIAFMFLYQFQTHGHLKLWLDLAYPVYNALFWICLAASFISSIFFTCSFLQVHIDEALWYKIMAALVGIALLQGGLGICGYSLWANQIARGLGIIEPLVIIALAIFRLRQGFRPARYYLLAWGVLSLGILAWILVPNRTAAATILAIATASEAILLSLALSARFKILRLKEMTLTHHMHYYRDLSLTDELTGLYNRRYLKNKLGHELAKSLRDDKRLALLILDIDYFKEYNDSYGHWQGDQVLIRLGKVLLNILDCSQLAFRYGGEEFVVLLPNCSDDAAAAIAEDIRSEFQEEKFAPAAHGLVQVTVSIGLTILKPNDTVEVLFQRADKALYKAKDSGRNQVAVL
ncbi:MAG: sensor domain-containing diguanylate cyclase [Pelosinus sp.]|nr:sensor domain-containing diguanylate cyclase [Pelosinus sp.]